MQNDEISCPGQNTMFWKPDDIYDVKCPSCGKPVEFWKDDSKRTCDCGHRFLNPKRDLGCLEYCKYAEDCMPEMFEGENLKALYRDRLLVAAKIVLKTENSRLERSQAVAELAEEILDGEGGQPKVVFAATILGDLVLDSQPQGGRADSSDQGDSPSAIIKKVLANLGTEKEVVDQVCQIVEHRINGTSSGDVNHKIVSDAMTLADLLEKQALLEKPAIEKLIDSKIQTPTGKRVAREQLLIEVES
jgi:DNA-directed RNA polymerase subunit RPC12/RpoP